MKIIDLINTIPENSEDEALLAIESIKLDPANNSAIIRCHAAHKFRLSVVVSEDQAIISTEQREYKIVPVDQFLSALKREIYEIDKLIASGGYSQSKPKSCVVFTDSVPPAPDNMDLPTWDPKTKKWYDAEY